MRTDTLFLSGSYESQRVARLGTPDGHGFLLSREIRRHFLYSCLLSDQVVQPIGHFYQSEIMRNITKEFQELFVPNEFNDGYPVARYALSMQKEDFYEDAEEKAKSYLGEQEFACYHDPALRCALTEQAGIFSPYRRRGKQVDSLASTTLRECGTGGSLYRKVLYTLGDANKVQTVLTPILKAVEQKEYAILPEYIAYLDEDRELKGYITLARIVLINAYGESCAQLYANAYVNNPIKRYYPSFFEQDHTYEIHYLDTNLFDIFLETLPEMREKIDHMNARQLLSLRQSPEFTIFKDFYVRFISKLKDELEPLDIKRHFQKAYIGQRCEYQKMVKKTIEDPPYILYRALEESLQDRKIEPTTDYLDYDSFPIMAFAVAVMERVVGCYEKYLYQYYRAKQAHEKRAQATRNPLRSGIDPPLHRGMEEEGDTAAMADQQIRIGIITALEKEYAAVIKTLKNTKECFFEGKGAGHRFSVGEIPSANGGVHKVALGLCGMGNNTAAIRTTKMQAHFPHITSFIMVGIAGGIPMPSCVGEHVRLGDIVVSEGVVQYDFGKEDSGKWSCRSEPAKPAAELLEAVSAMKIKEYDETCNWKKLIDKYAKKAFAHPTAEDILHGPQGEIIPHPEDPTRDGYPKVFKGKIASANTLLKDYAHRQALREQFSVRAVEMEASGIADAAWDSGSGYLVVRGICDYCDGYKNDLWQHYAAMAAACYTRDLLEHMPSF